VSFRHKLIAPASDLAIGMCGVYLGTYQISLMQITQNFHLDSMMKGVLIAIQYAGLCLPPLFLGTLSEKIGKRGVVSISLPLMILGAALISLTNQLGLFILGILLCGAGYGVTEATLTATLGVEFNEKSTMHLGVSQVCFSLGAVLSPLWCDALFNTGFNYHHVFGLVGVALIATYAIFLSTRFEHDIKGSVQSGIGHAFRLFSQRTFLLIAVSIFMSVGIEEVVAFYMGSYMELTLNLPEYSALALSLFWAGMIPSRLLLGAIRLHHKTLFTICGTGITVCALGVIFIPILELRLALFALMGLFIGPTWPLIMDIAAKSYPESAGAVSNVMLSLGCVGGIAVPLVIGALVIGANFVPMFFATAFCGIIMSIAFRLSNKKNVSYKNT